MGFFKRWREQRIERAQANAVAEVQSTYAGLLIRVLNSNLPKGPKRRCVIHYWLSFRNCMRVINNRPAQQSYRHMRHVFLSVLRDVRKGGWG